MSNEPESPDERSVLISSGLDGFSLQDREWVTLRARDCLGVLRASGEVRVRLVGDAEMASAHERHCGVPGTTDVITFDLTDGASARGAALDVDLLVCVDEAERQALARGHALRSEVLLYIVHGVLHCLGHDDHAEDDAATMHAREDEVLRAIGVGATFASGEAGS